MHPAEGYLDGPLIEWLLQAETPSVRLITLRDLLERPTSDAALRQAVRDVAASGPVPTILAAQQPEGYWFTRRNYYSPKYRSTHWSMLLLTELEAAPSEQRLTKGADFMLSITRDESTPHVKMGRQKESCFWGNLLRYVAHAGMQDDPRVELAINDLVSRGLRDNWVCPHFGDRCLWGVLRALWGLATLASQQRTAAVNATIDSGLCFLLEEHNLVAPDFPQRSTYLKNWHRLAFPHFAHADLLFALRVLADLDTLGHPAAQRALDWLQQKRRSDGRWQGASPFGSRTWQLPGGREDVDRWVSLRATLVLQKAGSVHLPSALRLCRHR
jgi:hypothetical protein